MKILAIGPHTDDIELGIGATLAKFSEREYEIRCLVLSYCGNDDLRHECTNSLLSLNVAKIRFCDFRVRVFNESRQAILDVLIEERDAFDPDLVFIPSPKTHQDHQVTNQEALRAFRNHDIYQYELPWNEWNEKSPSAITEEHLNKKLTALSRYESQKDRPYFDPEYIKALAKTRGTEFRCDLAEAFKVIRHKI